MQVQLTKRFFFSASYSDGSLVRAHNYALSVTVEWTDLSGLEERIVRQVQESLIDKVHSRDLGLHVDFLKGSSINELNLTTVFWGVVKKAVAPVKLLSLTLEKDGTSQLTLSQNQHEKR